MKPASGFTHPIDDLLSKVLDSTLDDGEQELLAELLRRDPQARRLYHEHIALHALLHWKETDGSADVSGAASAGRPCHPSEIASRNSEAPSPSLPVPGPEPLIPPIVLDLSSTLPRTPGLFAPGGWLFSYAAATVIMGVVILGAWVYKVSLEGGMGFLPAHVAATSHAPSLPDKPERELVGQITGTADCRWADPQDKPPAAIPLGRKYDLASGLVEISYQSGARVILQGPCSYQVDSPTGGFLSLGKLTARVGERGEGREERGTQVSNQKSAIENPSPLSPPPSPLFVVRTPTAVVTDLGTEFGVEVDEQGRTESYVFVGKVKIVPAGAAEDDEETTTLGAGQTARCQKGERIAIVPASAAKPGRFVRSLRPEAVRIVEKFDGPKLGPSLEQVPPGRYAIGQGAAVYQQPANTGGRQSRGYIRTVKSDFWDCDFVCEVTIDVRLDAADPGNISHVVYFGIGSGEPNPNYHGEMTCGVVLAFCADTGLLHVQPGRPDWPRGRIFEQEDIAVFVPSGPLPPGRHRLRMLKRGKWLQFLVDADFNGEFHTDFQCRYLDLAAVMPLLNSTNSHLAIGTGNCDTMSVRFEDLSIVYTKPPGSKGKPAMNGP